jgi:hypothetical protein
MAKPVYADVKVNYDKATRKLTCDPDFVRLFYKEADQPSRARWIFESVPDGADAAVIEVLPERPDKYPPNPPFFKPHGVFHGLGSGKKQGSLLPVIVSGPNTLEQGVFFYLVRIVDADGVELAVTDPGGTNDPGHPPIQYP